MSPKILHLLPLLAFQAATWIALVFDIPILRPLLGFIYLTFLPGLCILTIVGFQVESLAERGVYSIGLSLSFLMLIGLTINEIYPTFGIATPLSTIFLASAIGPTVLVLSLAAAKNGRHLPSFSLAELNWLRPASILLACLPLVSLAGAVLMKNDGNDFLLLSLFVMISVLILLGVFKKVPSELHVLAIISVALALLFQTTLISNYLNGWDIHLEYYLAEITRQKSHWDMSVIPQSERGVINYNAMLSITILPALFSNILGIDIVSIYTIVYPIIFASVPLALYKIYENVLDRQVAFLSTLFFMSFSVFYVEMAYLARQMIGELFFVLLMLLLLNMYGGRGKFGMLVIFGAALAVSHYSLSYICLYYLLVMGLLSRVFKATRRQLSTAYFALFLVITLSWYVFTASANPLGSLVTVFSSVGRGILTEFFNLAARGQSVGLVLSVGPELSLVHRISRISVLATVFFVILGFISTVARRGKLSTQYLSASFGSIALILLSVVLPYFGSSLNLARIYQICLLLAAPFCILGVYASCDWASDVSHKVLHILHPLDLPSFKLDIRSILLTVLLITYFLSQAGFLYSLSGDVPSSVSLTADKSTIVRGGNIGLYVSYTLGEDVYSARWLSDHMDFAHPLYSDSVSQRQVLTSYGLFQPWHTRTLYPSTQMAIPKDCYVYLSQLNVIYHITVDENGNAVNATDILGSLRMANKIYSNGGGEIYYCVVELQI